MFKHKLTLKYLSKNILIVVGLVMIWRGIFYALDQLDELVFGGNHVWTALGGIVVGFLILYLPDKNLNEIDRT